MKSFKERTKARPNPQNVIKVTEKIDDDIKKIQAPKTLVEKLSRIEKFIFDLDRLNRTKNLAQMKNIDLIKFLRGTQYSTKIEEFFEFDLIINQLEEGFNKLQCSHPDCNYQAVMAFKGNRKEPSIQYCDYHFIHSHDSKGSPKYFEYELRLLKILFYELGEQLIYIQDRIDYIKSDKNQNNLNMYSKIEEEVQRNLGSINNTLKTMAERIDQINEINKKKSNNKASVVIFNDFSFVREKLYECRENILTILSLISGPSSKNQAAFLLQVLMDFKNEIDFEVERKDIPNTSIPIEIYNSDYEMVNFPAQSLQSIKKFEQKINTICEYVRTLQKGAQELVQSYNLIKQIFQDPLVQHEMKDQHLLEKEYKEELAQLTLKDTQFYKYKMKVNEVYWDKYFPGNSEMYNSLKAFPYKYTDFLFKPISTKTYENKDGCKCVGIGQFREGTNDLHGVGIQVDQQGDIFEGYWKNGRLHGQGRYIYNGGYYSTGEFEEGNCNAKKYQSCKLERDDPIWNIIQLEVQSKLELSKCEKESKLIGLNKEEFELERPELPNQLVLRLKRSKRHQECLEPSKEHEELMLEWSKRNEEIELDLSKMREEQELKLSKRLEKFRSERLKRQVEFELPKSPEESQIMPLKRKVELELMEWPKVKEEPKYKWEYERKIIKCESPKKI